ncbi:MAG TPA: hypothetical protein VK900_02055 [Anaerolineales bacterium]|nr:hypothetical protein [Anaerolineales bacterium]
MNTFFKTLSLLAILAFSAACGVVDIPPMLDVAQAAPAEAGYQITLGKSMSDRTVADFIAGNSCHASGSFQLCPSAGLALWADDERVVETAYLYIASSGNFVPYRGELPLGLERTDTMMDIEEKLGQPVVVYAPQAGWEPGLPDESSAPDRIHYRAVYSRFGITILYNSPSPKDKNTGIHAILVSR